MRMLVLGAGISGRGAISLASRLGYDVAVYDRDPAALTDLADITTHSGGWQVEWLETVEVVVASPFAARHLTAPIVAVTGTNGKTTVTTLIAAMLEASGVAAVAAGNIGTALTDIVGLTPDLIVVEVSSFQLRFVEKFAPAVAVLLNIAPDHLDWHQTFDRYREAKANLIKNAGPDIPLVFDVDDPEARAVAVSGSAQQVPVSGTERVLEGWGVEGDLLILDGLELPLDEVPIDDPAYLLDLAAAGTAAIIAGADPEAVAKVIRTFEPVIHRRTVVGTWTGITWIDDSKATNPHSARAAVAAYPSVVLIAGGRNKGLDLAPIVTHQNVRGVVAIGEAAGEIMSAAGKIPSIEAKSMESAVAAAQSMAQPGDVVLLAPGCASFDMFDDYEQRGDVFRQAVRDMEEGK
jgi:UDP-N-acetylmuramoylalanine--D-glutamate ligase